MSPARWALSLAFLAHLSALAIGSLPPPDALDPSSSSGLPRGSIAQAVAPSLDWLAARTFRLHAAIWRVSAPVRPLANGYLGLFRLQQTWSMFWDPPQIDKYLRVRYYVTAQGTPSWTASELVLPLDREDRVRPPHRYGNVSRNKAVATALNTFSRRAREAPSAPIPDDLAPVARYFTRRFARNHLRPGERVTHAEVWYGYARNALTGANAESAARRAVLSRYHDAPGRSPAPDGPYPGVRATEREADIQWILYYTEDL